MIPFVGRVEELKELQRLSRRKTASLAVIRGRRRIGKSRLVKEFAKSVKGTKFYTFTGLPPAPETTPQSQRAYFATRFAEQFGIAVRSEDWHELFTSLAKMVSRGRVIILFDEISWMAQGDPDFLGKLKTIWDDFFSANSQLILVLCGSVSTWIQKNIISSTGFRGRINLSLVIEELSLAECNRLLELHGFTRSPMEKFMILAITGGVPWYIEQVDGALSAADNIQKMCFAKTGVLVTEFKYIFSDLFGGRKGEMCVKIIERLARGPADFREIARHIEHSGSGVLSDYLTDLVTSGFVSKDVTWDIKTRKPSKFSKYRLKDNYLRFFMKYIEPKFYAIEKGQYHERSVTTLPGWDAIMGLQFENLVCNNAKEILSCLEIKPAELVFANPFFQRRTERKPGCQIDYLIQTEYNTLFVCEVKFSQKEVGPSVIREVKKKIENLSLPRNYAAVAVLIVVNGAEPAVEQADYFVSIIDFASLLKNESSRHS